MEDLTGKQFGPYQIVIPLGEGGMAAVYKAYQPGMDRYIALKILPRHFAQDPQFVARFEQEAKILAKLQHPHILPVFDYGQADGYTYIVMPFLQSGALTGLMGGAPLPLTQIRRIISQVGDALDYAHSRGLIHRDVKPSNVLLDERGNCLLTDFGIAKMVESSAHLTATGGFIGTPAYMSPEQGLGQKLDGRSDIYALGIILYEMVTGRVPYKAETPMAVVVKHINDSLPPPRQVNPNLPEALERVILKALAKRPEDRYATAGDMVRAIQAVIPEPVAESAPADESATAVAIASSTTGGVAVKTVGQETPATEAATVAAPRRSQPAKSKWILIAAGLALVVVTAGIGLATMLVGQPVATPATEAPAVSASATVEGASSGAVATPPTASPIVPTLYDDFNDPAYEGKINPAKWIPLSNESCHIAQQAGVMAFKNTRLPTEVGCNLVVTWPEQVTVGDLGVFEARLQISSDHNGEYLNQGITFGTDDSPGGGWYAFCGLNASGETPEALFEAVDWATGENYDIEQTALAEYDRWYTFRLEANPETMTFDCYVDNTQLGSVAPAEAAALSNANFERGLNAWRDAEAMGTTYVDDVRMTLGPMDAAKSAPAMDEADSLYDDFDDSAFEGEWNPELWEAWESISRCEVEQQEGILRFSCTEPDGSGLNALDYTEVPFGELGFIETRLRLDDEIQTNNGAVIVKLYTSLDSWAECGLVGGVESDAVHSYCGVYTGGDVEYEVAGPLANYDTWRLVRLELNPETAAITFFVDGQRIGAYTPSEVEALKQAELTVELHIYFEEGTLITGYFDEVWIGP
jgi:hypothetical protein